MKSGDNSNNVQIGGAGSGNTITIVQNQSRPDHVQLDVDKGSVREYERQKLEKDRNVGYVKAVAAGLLGGLGFLSDAIGVSGHFGLSLWWLFPVGIVGALLLVQPHLRSAQVLGRIPKDASEANFVGNSEVVEEPEKGRIVTYRPSASCIYPNCPGSIVLSPPPERERCRLQRDFVGVCSLAGRDHSYRIDYIWNAYPEQFDWRPAEKTARNA